MKILHVSYLALLFTLLACALPSIAAPFQPENDSVVLETLPGKPGDPAAIALRGLRAAVAASPRDA